LFLSWIPITETETNYNDNAAVGEKTERSPPRRKSRNVSVAPCWRTLVVRFSNSTFNLLPFEVIIATAERSFVDDARCCLLGRSFNFWRQFAIGVPHHPPATAVNHPIPIQFQLTPLSSRYYNNIQYHHLAV
jgi:hypothetical protein